MAHTVCIEVSTHKHKPNAYRGSDNNPYKQAKENPNPGGYNGGSSNPYGYPNGGESNGGGGQAPPGGYNPSDPNGGGGVY